MSSFGCLPDNLLKSLSMNPILKDFTIPNKNKSDILFKYKTKLS